MSSTDVVKKSVGEDVLVYEKKGKDATHFRSQAKLLFSANGMPENLDDKSDAYYRRLLVLELDHVIAEDQKDTRLKSKVAKEMEFAVHMAVGALQALYERGHFEESEHSKEMVEKLRRASDSVQAFLDEMICRKDSSRIHGRFSVVLFRPRKAVHLALHSACPKLRHRCHGHSERY